MYTNEHQKCIIQQKKGEITQLKGQLLDVKVKLDSKPCDTSHIQVEQEILSLKQQLLNAKENEEKLKDDLTKTTHIYKETLAKLEDSHQLIQRHLQNADAHRLEAGLLSTNLCECRDRNRKLEVAVDSLNKELDIQKSLHSQAVETWAIQEEEWRLMVNQLSSELEVEKSARADFEQLSTNWSEQNMKLTEELSKAKEILEVPKEDGQYQTQLSMLNTSDTECQVQPELSTLASQTEQVRYYHVRSQTDPPPSTDIACQTCVPELAVRSTQTKEPPLVNRAAQTEAGEITEWASKKRETTPFLVNQFSQTEPGEITECAVKKRETTPLLVNQCSQTEQGEIIENDSKKKEVTPLLVNQAAQTDQRETTDGTSKTFSVQVQTEVLDDCSIMGRKTANGIAETNLNVEPPQKFSEEKELPLLNTEGKKSPDKSFQESKQIISPGMNKIAGSSILREPVSEKGRNSNVLSKQPKEQQIQGMFSLNKDFVKFCNPEKDETLDTKIGSNEVELVESEQNGNKIGEVFNEQREKEITRLDFQEDIRQRPGIGDNVTRSMRQQITAKNGAEYSKVLRNKDDMFNQKEEFPKSAGVIDSLISDEKEENVKVTESLVEKVKDTDSLVEKVKDTDSLVEKVKDTGSLVENVKVNVTESLVEIPKKMSLYESHLDSYLSKINKSKLQQNTVGVKLIKPRDNQDEPRTRKYQEFLQPVDRSGSLIDKGPGSNVKSPSPVGRGPLSLVKKRTSCSENVTNQSDFLHSRYSPSTENSSLSSNHGLYKGYLLEKEKLELPDLSPYSRYKALWKNRTENTNTETNTDVKVRGRRHKNKGILKEFPIELESQSDRKNVTFSEDMVQVKEILEVPKEDGQYQTQLSMLNTSDTECQVQPELSSLASQTEQVRYYHVGSQTDPPLSIDIACQTCVPESAVRSTQTKEPPLVNRAAQTEAGEITEWASKKRETTPLLVNQCSQTEPGEITECAVKKRETTPLLVNQCSQTEQGEIIENDSKKKEVTPLLVNQAAQTDQRETNDGRSKTISVQVQTVVLDDCSIMGRKTANGIAETNLNVEPPQKFSEEKELPLLNTEGKKSPDKIFQESKQIISPGMNKIAGSSILREPVSEKGRNSNVLSKQPKEQQIQGMFSLNKDFVKFCNPEKDETLDTKIGSNEVELVESEQNGNKIGEVFNEQREKEITRLDFQEDIRQRPGIGDNVTRSMRQQNTAKDGAEYSKVLRNKDDMFNEKEEFPKSAGVIDSLISDEKEENVKVTESLVENVKVKDTDSLVENVKVNVTESLVEIPKKMSLYESHLDSYLSKINKSKLQQNTVGVKLIKPRDNQDEPRTRKYQEFLQPVDRSASLIDKGPGSNVKSPSPVGRGALSLVKKRTSCSENETNQSDFLHSRHSPSTENSSLSSNHGLYKGYLSEKEKLELPDLSPYSRYKALWKNRTESTNTETNTDVKVRGRRHKNKGILKEFPIELESQSDRKNVTFSEDMVQVKHMTPPDSELSGDQSLFSEEPEDDVIEVMESQENCSIEKRPRLS